MKQLERSALLPYSAAQVYALVNDVSRYPEFMDGCEGVEILAQSEQSLRARVYIVKKGIKQSFVTANTMQPGQRIDMALEEGPFKRLDGYWEFKALSEDACKVSLKLTLEFNNALLAALAGKWFDGMADRQVDAVCKRAKEIYG